MSGVLPADVTAAIAAWGWTAEEETHGQNKHSSTHTVQWWCDAKFCNAIRPHPPIKYMHAHIPGRSLCHMNTAFLIFPL